MTSRRGKSISAHERVDKRRLRPVVQRARHALANHLSIARMPLHTHPCVGREAELEQLSHWLNNPRTRLLTVAGPSGIGKTHLACEFARQCLARGYRVAYVNLIRLNRAEQIVHELFHVLDVSFPGDSVWQWMVSRVFHRPTLLVLDDFPPLPVPEATRFIHELLFAAPPLQILITASQPLDIVGEQVLALSPLPPPHPDQRTADALRKNPCVQLLLTYANPNFQLNPYTAERIARVCIEQGGYPGRLVQVATLMHGTSFDRFFQRYQQWRAQQQAAGYDQAQQVAKRFAELREEQRRVILCWSVFVGSFGISAAAAVARISPNAVAEMLSQLEAKQLVQRVASEPEPRYQLHPALAQLPIVTSKTPAQQRELALRLQQYYSGQLHYWQRNRLAVDSIRRHCFDERETLQRTFEWLAHAGETNALIALMAHLVEACGNRPPAIILDWGLRYATHATTLSDAERIAIAKPLMLGLIFSGLNEWAHQLARWLANSPEFALQMGRWHHNLADGAKAREYYIAAWLLAEQRGDRVGAARAYMSLAESEAVIGNLATAEQLIEDVRRYYPPTRLPDAERSEFHYVVGYLSYQQGRFRRSLEAYQTALRYAQDGTPIWREMSRVHLEMGNPHKAIQLAEEALGKLRKDVEAHQPSIHALYGCLGDAYTVLADYDTALDYHQRALQFWRTLRQPRWICWSLNRLAEIELMTRDNGHSWRLAQQGVPEARALLEEAWQVIEPTYLNLLHRARTVHNLGWLAWHEARYEDAEQYLLQALELRRTCGAEYGVMRTLELLGRVYTALQCPDEARRCYSEASAIRARLRLRYHSKQVKSHNLSAQRRRRA